MATIVTRAGKGSPLTNTEVDSNFTNLNTDKLETSGGTLTGDLSFGDNDKAIFGAGSDLQIYHDGSNSYIDEVGTGSLSIRTNGSGILLETGTGYGLRALTGGQTDLWHNGSMKLATTSTGIDVTGTVTADGLTVDGKAEVNGVGSTTGIQLDNGAQAHKWYLVDNFTNRWDIGTSSLGAIYNFGSNSGARNHLQITTGGDISFYEDTGTTPKFFWDASAESLAVDGVVTVDRVINATTSADPWLKGVNGSGTETSFLKQDGSAYFGGNVGIGTTNPTSALDVTGTVVTDGLTVAGNVSVDGGTIKLNGNYPVGTGNVALGDGALDDASLSGGYNTAVGYQAGYSNTTGYVQAFGSAALYSNTTGTNNSAFGANALYTNTTGSNNHASGVSALYSNSTGSYNTGVGRHALASNTTASNNTAVGYQAGYSNTTGGQNTIVGRQAMYAGTTSIYNVVVGSNALYANSTGSRNVAIGTFAMQNTTTGVNNAALGHESLYSNTTASNNTAVGYQAGYSNTTGAENTLVGRRAGYNTTGNFNSALGSDALYANTTGANSVAIGLNSLSSNTTGSYNTGVGTSALQSNTTASNNTAVGYRALQANTGGDSVAVGSSALQSATTSIQNVAVGLNALLNTTSGTRNVAVGTGSGQNNTTGQYNVAIGQECLYSNTTASNNTAVGYQAGYSGTTGLGNTYFGKGAGYTNTTSAYNVFLGYEAGYSYNTSGNTFNTFVGVQSGYAVTTGTKNTILGGYSGNQGGLDIRTSSNYIVLSDGDGNPRQVIASNGNVGIGTSSPANPLHVKTTDASTNIRIENSGGNAYIGSNGNDLVLFSATTEKMRIDSSGNVGIGTSSPTYKAHLYNSGYTGLVIDSGRTSSSDNVGGVHFSTTGTEVAYIQSQVDGTIKFRNTSSLQERMRIDSSGRLLINTTSAFATGYRQNIQVAGTAGGLAIKSGGTAMTALSFSNGSGTTIGSIGCTNTATSYVTSSDYRLKEDWQPMSGSIDRVKALNPVNFAWKVDGSRVDGFLAHEAQEVVPEAIHGTKDAVDAEGNPEYQGIDQSKLVPLLTSALQEAIAEIESLKARVAALEN